MTNTYWAVLVVVIVLIGGGLLFWTTTHPGSFGTTATTTVTTTTNSGGTPVATRQAAQPSVVTSSDVAPSNSTAVVSGTVTPNGAQTSYWFEYGKTASLGARTSSQSIGSGFNGITAPGYIIGLAANTQYYFRLSASNALGTVNGATKTFTTSNTPPPPAHVPTLETSAASGIGRTSATLNGQVNPNGFATSYWFEYGEGTNLGDTTGVQSAGSGTSNTAASVALSGLKPLTKYYFRMNAQNKYGTINGTMLSFTTSGPAEPSEPSAHTSAASGISASAATLNGTINPDGAETTYWFEYSDNSLLGSVVGTKTQTQTLASGTATVGVSANISGLASSTKYYVRLVAQNSHGTDAGDVVSFTTL